MMKIQPTLLKLASHGSRLYILTNVAFSSVVYSCHVYTLACLNGLQVCLEYKPVLNISLNSNSANTDISTASNCDNTVFTI